MRSAFPFAALCGLAGATPQPQGINVGAADDLPLPSILGHDLANPSITPSAYNDKQAAASAAAAISTAPATVEKRDGFEKRGACSQELGGQATLMAKTIIMATNIQLLQQLYSSQE